MSCSNLYTSLADSELTHLLCDSSNPQQVIIGLVSSGKIHCLIPGDLSPRLYHLIIGKNHETHWFQQQYAKKKDNLCYYSHTNMQVHYFVLYFILIHSMIWAWHLIKHVLLKDCYLSTSYYYCYWIFVVIHKIMNILLNNNWYQ